jgi:hypothetical protein
MAARLGSNFQTPRLIRAEPRLEFRLGSSLSLPPPAQGLSILESVSSSSVANDAAWTLQASPVPFKTLHTNTRKRLIIALTKQVEELKAQINDLRLLLPRQERLCNGLESLFVGCNVRFAVAISFPTTVLKALEADLSETGRKEQPLVGEL